MNPTVYTISSPTCLLVKHLVGLLSPLIQLFAYHIKNSDSSIKMLQISLIYSFLIVEVKTSGSLYKAYGAACV
jgi:hypothetical protein